MKGFDVKAQAGAAEAEDAGSFVHVVDLNDRPMYYTDENGVEQPVGIEVAGIQSSRYRQIEGKQRRRKMRPKDLNGQRIFEDNVERIAFCTLRWQGFFNGENPVELTQNNAYEIYLACPWLLDQLVEVMADHTRFFTSKSSSSESTSNGSVG